MSADVGGTLLNGHSTADAEPESIFVSIIAYRDPELIPTLRSMYSRAAHPQRVIAGVVWQGDDADPIDAKVMRDLDAFASSLPSSACIRQLRLSHLEARGPCFARALAQERLFADESFYLQIDSHMRFALDWDRQIIEQWKQCGDDKAVLTTYPPPYQRESTEAAEGKTATASSASAQVAAASSSSAAAAPASHSSFSESDPPTVLCASHFHPSDGMLRICGRLLAASPAAPLRSSFYAAGFAFSPGSSIRAAPYDRHLQNLFFGEESSMACRLYTAGYSFWTPTRNLLWHCWSRDYRPSFREVTKDDPKQQRREQIARHRVRAILGMTATAETKTEGADDAVAASSSSAVASAASPVSASAAAADDLSDPTLSPSLLLPAFPYSVGTVRSVADFYEETGVNFATGVVSERARNGGLEPSMFRTPLEASKQQQTGTTANDASKLSQLDRVMQIVRKQQQQKAAAAQP